MSHGYSQVYCKCVVHMHNKHLYNYTAIFAARFTFCVHAVSLYSTYSSIVVCHAENHFKFVLINIVGVTKTIIIFQRRT